MAKLVKIHNDTYDKLKGMRRKAETFDEAITRLLTLYELLKKVRANGYE